MKSFNNYFKIRDASERLEYLRTKINELSFEQYVDDCKTCLEKTDFKCFLNSILKLSEKSKMLRLYHLYIRPIKPISKVLVKLRGMEVDEAYFDNERFRPEFIGNKEFMYGGETEKIFARFSDLKNIAEYEKIFELLQDEKSKLILCNILCSRLADTEVFFSRYFEEFYDGDDHPPYFDREIIKVSDDEVFVDCGGFIGDTALSYMYNYGRCKKYWLYEPDETNLKQVQCNLNSYNYIVVRPCGVGEKTQQLRFIANCGGANMVSDKGDTIINIVSLDEDIKESIDFIKMDIEGSEMAALVGSKRHIIEEKPKLAICVYHKYDDIHKLCEYIRNLNPEYKFYLRHYNRCSCFETVLYAVI